MKKLTPFLAAFLVLFMSGCSNNSTTDEQNGSASSSQVSTIENGSWERVNKETFWHNDSYFADDEYNFPNITFEYPSKWKFNCCGDMDHASVHLFCSEDIAERAKSAVYVRTSEELCGKKYMSITDYGLSGCPSGKWDCSIEEIVPKTAQQKYNDEVQKIRANTGAIVLPEMHVASLNIDAFVYAKNDSTRSYLINLGDDVIDIEFTLDNEIDDSFIANFLSRVRRDKN